MSLDDRAYSEKRDFIRMRVEAEVILEHEGKQYPAKCLDLSSTGMQVEVDAPCNWLIACRFEFLRNTRNCGAWTPTSRWCVAAALMMAAYPWG